MAGPIPFLSCKVKPEFGRDEEKVQSESVIEAIESVADPNLAESWDQSGIQVAAPRRSIHRLAVSLDPTPSILRQALAWHADFILTHHPLSLNPQLPAKLDSYHACLHLLLNNDLWLYSAHTSLDVRTLGPVSWLAKELGLIDLTPVQESENSRASTMEEPVGLGVMGRCRTAMTWSGLSSELSRATGLASWRRAGTPPQHVHRVAYCPGSGMNLAQGAFAQGADVFISGELKYHTAQELEGLGLTLDMGHFSLEEIMMQTWTEQLRSAMEPEKVKVAFFPGHDPITCDI